MYSSVFGASGKTKRSKQNKKGFISVLSVGFTLKIRFGVKPDPPPNTKNEKHGPPTKQASKFAIKGLAPHAAARSLAALALLGVEGGCP